MFANHDLDPVYSTPVRYLSFFDTSKQPRREEVIASRSSSGLGLAELVNGGRTFWIMLWYLNNG